MLLLFYFLFFACAKGLRLRQTIIFSRHNLRVPLSENLGDYTNKNIPKWTKTSGQLTEKGAQLEGYIADYLATWLTKNRLFRKKCPDKENILIYANNAQRTIDTGTAFVDAAFPQCNINVMFKKNQNKRDSTFNPVIHNTSKSFEETVTNEVEEMLENLQLKDAYKELDKIIDLKTSRICQKDGLCDLVNDENVILYKPYEELQIKGPLHIGNALVDNFIMSYYEGRPLKEIAWGQITNQNQWRRLIKITKADQQIRFNIPSAVDDIVTPLLKYMKSLFLNPKIKFALLVGHDSNLICIVNSLNFVPFELKEQFEPYPIGGKIVFQKWEDTCGDKYLKIEYVYLSWKQIRDGAEINSKNLPLRQTLKLNGCGVDENGFCPWNDFLKLLEKY